MPKRLIVTAPRQVELEEVPIPGCPDDGLLVRAKVTAVSTGTEIRVYRGIPVDKDGGFLHTYVPFQYPYINGESMVGKVLEVGAEVSGFGVGDRVFVTASHGHYAAVSAGEAIKLPAQISDEVAAFLNILEVGHIGLRKGSPQPGENVAIIGAGVIGLSALAYCRSFGFRTAVVEFARKRLDLAGEMGADLMASPEAEDFSDRILEFFGGEGADLVLEAASVWPAIETGMQIARIGARVVVIARHTDEPTFSAVGHPYLGKDLALLTSYGYQPDGQRWDRRRSNALTVDLLSKEKLLVSPMITDRFDWQELPDVYRRLDQGDKGLVGVVIQWS